MGKKEEMGDREQDTPCVGWGQAPGARSDALSGKLRCWADSVQGPGVKLQAAGERPGVKEVQGAELSGEKGGVESRDRKAGGDPPLGSSLWTLLSGGEGV